MRERSLNESRHDVIDLHEGLGGKEWTRNRNS
jgi:hypothetical protein